MHSKSIPAVWPNVRILREYDCTMSIRAFQDRQEVGEGHLAGRAKESSIRVYCAGNRYWVADPSQVFPLRYRDSFQLFPRKGPWLSAFSFREQVERANFSKVTFDAVLHLGCVYRIAQLLFFHIFS